MLEAGYAFQHSIRAKNGISTENFPLGLPLDQLFPFIVVICVVCSARSKFAGIPQKRTSHYRKRWWNSLQRNRYTVYGELYTIQSVDGGVLRT